MGLALGRLLLLRCSGFMGHRRRLLGLGRLDSSNRGRRNGVAVRVIKLLLNIVEIVLVVRHGLQQTHQMGTHCHKPQKKEKKTKNNARRSYQRPVDAALGSVLVGEHNGPPNRVGAAKRENADSKSASAKSESRPLSTPPRR